MKGRVRFTIMAAIGAAMLLSSPAYAGGAIQQFPPPAGGAHPEVVSDTGYQPTPSLQGESFKRSGCGTTVTLLVLADHVLERDVTYKNGDVKSYYKGEFVIQVSARNGRKAKADNSGPSTSLTYAATSDILYDLGGPALIYPFSQGESDAFKRAGLPSVFTYDRGRLQEYENSDGSRVRLLKQPEHVTNICRILHLPDY